MVKAVIFVALAMLSLAAARTLDDEPTPTNAKIVKFITSDNEIVEADKDVAKMSLVLKNLLEDLADVEDFDDAIPLTQVKGNTLEKVLKWAEHHRNDPAVDENRRDVEISQWDKEFLDELTQDQLLEVLMAANFMDIKVLLDMTCKTVADMIRGKSPEQIRATFNIENDFTPEEEAQVREQNQWSQN